MSSRVAEPGTVFAPSPKTALLVSAGALLLPAAIVARAVPAAAVFATAFIAVSASVALRYPRLFAMATLVGAPLAVDWSAPGFGAHLTLPLEGMLVLALAALVARERGGLLPTRAQAAHPLTLLVLAQVGWVLVSAALSTDARVSVKFALIRILYVGSFYIVGLRLCDTGPALARALVALGAGFIPVTILALGRFAASGLDPKSVYESAQPFFQNRVDLCAALALWLLPAVAAWKARAAFGLGPIARALLAAALLLSCAALVGLRGRAALGAMVIALVAVGFARRRPPRLVVAILVVGMMGVAGLTADLIGYRSEITRPGSLAAVSSVRAALLASPPFFDESFRERANRWSAAARMGRSRPLTGFGPGTFERRYAPYQNAWETTRRSTWRGDEGDAHSEWMTAFAEQGLPGLAILLAVLSAALLAAARGARRAPSGPLPMPAAVAGSLVAFFVLNGPNSLLDVDKVAPLFWILCAAAVNLDLGSRRVATSPEGR